MSATTEITTTTVAAGSYAVWQGALGLRVRVLRYETKAFRSSRMVIAQVVTADLRDAGTRLAMPAHELTPIV